jgi:hypothetical protein
MGISDVGKVFGARNAFYLVQFDPPIQVVGAAVSRRQLKPSDTCPISPKGEISNGGRTRKLT